MKMVNSFLFVDASKVCSDSCLQEMRALVQRYFPYGRCEMATPEQFHSNPGEFSGFDLILTHDAAIEKEAGSSGMDAILWSDFPDLSAKLDEFVQLNRYRRRFPLDIEGLRLQEVLHTTQDAVVYSALDHRGKRFAVKRFKYQLDAISDASVRHFIETLETQCHLDHPGLVRIYSGGINHQAFYLVMEFMGYGTLGSSLRGCGRLPLQHALEWFHEILDALARVHQAGLIHRDLKTENIMLREDGSLALSDYGVSKHVLLDNGIIGEHDIHCSPYYVSPEQILENQCNRASDLYSLGVILHELLTGEKPYQGSKTYALLTQHVIAPIPALPDNLARYQPLLNQLLAKDPVDRFASTEEVMECFDLLNF